MIRSFFNSHSLLVATVAMLLPALVGCPANSSPNPESAVPAPAHAEHAEHDHPSEGPHGGLLIELGEEEYHAEFLHDETTVTIHLLDSSARSAAPIDAAEVTINLKDGDEPRQFQLAAAPEPNDPAGRSSRFSVEDPQLVELIEAEASAPRLSMMIDGRSFGGAIEHEHDHDHHHAH